MAPITIPTLEPTITRNDRLSWELHEEIYYPDSDGEPMAETEKHRKKLTYLADALENHFEDNPTVYVGGNMFLYYVEGNPYKFVAPDVFVVFGVVKKPDRRVYQIWKEGYQFPQVIIELTSQSTRKEDEVDKVILYRDLGVQEYFQYDPYQEYLSPALKGRRFRQGQPDQEIDGTWHSPTLYCMTSHVLDLELHLLDSDLWVFNPRTQTYLLSYTQEKQARIDAETRTQHAKAQAKQEIEARLQAEMRAKQAEEQAKQEAEARLQAEERAKHAEAQLQALLAKLAQQEKDTP